MLKSSFINKNGYVEMDNLKINYKRLLNSKVGFKTNEIKVLKQSIKRKDISSSNYKVSQNGHLQVINVQNQLKKANKISKNLH